jgi:TPR repeat protein
MSSGIAALHALAAVALLGLVAGCTKPMETRYSLVGPPLVVGRRAAPNLCTFGSAEECSFACNGGDHKSCNSYGAMLEMGIGVLENWNDAGAYYAKACQAGVRTACFNLRRWYIEYERDP